MKQRILRAGCAFLTVLFLNASVQAQTAAYTLHTITAGETLSALAKEYHTTVGDIMRLNDMHANSKLAVGQKIKIPATPDRVQRTSATPSKAEAAPATTAAAPANKEALTHTVQSGESLYRISKTYNVSVEKLIALNHLSNAGEIKVGQVLQVSDGTPPPPPSKNRTEAPATAAKQPVNDVPPPATQAKQTPPVNNTPVNNTGQLTSAAPVQTQSSTPVVPANNNAPAQTAQPAFATNVAAPKEGFFTAQYRQNVEGRSEQTKTGAAMTFKSASGWADKKFYILMNDAPPGSIVQVKNGSNVVYAKVLWSLGAQKENDGLDFRISTATAAALNITDEKFNVSVTYFQ